MKKATKFCLTLILLGSVVGQGLSQIVNIEERRNFSR